MEHMSRRITTSIDHLFIVSNPTLRGLLAAERIKELVKELKLSVGTMHMIINQARNGIPKEVEKRIEEIGVPLVGVIQDDDLLREYDGVGKPLIDLPESSSTVQKLDEIVGSINI
jgi:CO dehydrogenase maturation factor